MIEEKMTREKFHRSVDNPFGENVIESKQKYVAKKITSPWRSPCNAHEINSVSVKIVFC
jgi:hypothetical protein